MLHLKLEPKNPTRRSFSFVLAFIDHDDLSYSPFVGQMWTPEFGPLIKVDQLGISKASFYSCMKT